MIGDLFDGFGIPVDRAVGYRELRASGVTRSGIDKALENGQLIRARRNVYVSADVSPNVVKAQTVGGRVTCLTALQELGVFVLRNSRLHVQVERYDGRLRSPHSRRRSLATVRDQAVTVHWSTIDAPEGTHITPVIYALAHAALCQEPRATIASIDSALNKGVLASEELERLFGMLPARFGALRPLVDGRAEAGSETFARLLLRAFGRRVDVQKTIAGVGRVDLVIDGWLVVECDSRAFHQGWERQEADRERDLALAARGYVVIRPTANLVFHRPEVLIAAIRGLLSGRG
ncbi:endonuclease domain-containing protein [Microbacterium rhizomatis]|uniref:DUF559 domain-containing protein n=1 Tax=Microbacterium rhizomatis TaxID=1631477 RepID=A0A5J5J509_9MICO|nr:hypothetical protein [Microbacterium rhizomatis]KAA9111287.1 hypothetical protein F6B43_06775 [Microbacterium rhizomatis]